MILASVFNDGNKSTLEDKRKRTKKGHSPSMLLPVLNDLDQIAKKGNFIAIGEEFYSFRAFVSCVPLDTVQIPNLLRTKGHKSLYHCPVCLFVGARGVEHFCRFSDRCNPNVNIFDREAYNSYLERASLGEQDSKLHGPSLFVDMLPSIFPTQTITVDVLHTLDDLIFFW